MCALGGHAQPCRNVQAERAQTVQTHIEHIEHMLEEQHSGCWIGAHEKKPHKHSNVPGITNIEAANQQFFVRLEASNPKKNTKSMAESGAC